MRESRVTVKNAKQVMIFLKPELLEEVEKYWRRTGFKNRSRGIVDLIEKGLERAGEESGQDQ